MVLHTPSVMQQVMSLVMLQSALPRENHSCLSSTGKSATERTHKSTCSQIHQQARKPMSRMQTPFGGFEDTNPNSDEHDRVSRISSELYVISKSNPCIIFNISDNTALLTRNTSD